MPCFEASKERGTLLFRAKAAEDYRLKPLLVYHSGNPHALKGINKTTLRMHFQLKQRGWITISVFEDWFNCFFIPEVEKYRKDIGIPFKILLLLDNAPGHPTHLDDFNSYVRVTFLPPNMTSLIKHMDQGIISNFKKYYLCTKFAQALSAVDGEKNFTLKDF